MANVEAVVAEVEPVTPEFQWRRFVKIVDGVVVGDNESGTWDFEWAKFDAEHAQPADLVDVTDHPQWAGVGSLIGHTMDAKGQFTPPPAPPRKITRHTFLQRLGVAEDTCLEMLSMSTDPMQAQLAAQIRVFYRRLMSTVDGMVELDHPELIAGLTQAASVLIAAKVWTKESAVTRLAEIRA